MGEHVQFKLKKIVCLAKKAVRIVCNVDYQHPSNVLFIELHVFKLHDLIELRTAMIMCKAKTGCLPVNLQTMFHMSLERIHDTRNSKNVRQVFARTTKKANCITVHGIKLWNKIQDRIRRSHNLHTFRIDPRAPASARSRESQSARQRPPAPASARQSFFVVAASFG